MGKDTAEVGYFKTQLKNGVTVELSASRHAGIMEYSFPKGEKHVLVDVSHVRCLRLLLELVLTRLYSSCLPPPAVRMANSMLLARPRSKMAARRTAAMGLTSAGGTMVSWPSISRTRTRLIDEHRSPVHRLFLG